MPLESTRAYGWIVQNWAFLPSSGAPPGPLSGPQTQGAHCWVLSGCSCCESMVKVLCSRWCHFTPFSILFHCKPNMNWWWLKWAWLFLRQNMWQVPSNQGWSHFQSLWRMLATALRLHGCKSVCLLRIGLGRKLFPAKNSFFIAKVVMVGKWMSHVNTWIFPVTHFFNRKKHQTLYRELFTKGKPF